MSNPAKLGMDLHPHARGRRDDQRRGAAAVHRERRAHHRAGSRSQQRAAGGHRVGARSEWARHDQSVAGEAHIELVIDRHVNDHLPATAADDHEVVQRPLVRSIGGIDPERRKPARRPVPAMHALQSLLEALGVHGCERAEAPAGHSQHRCVVGRGRAQCGEHGTVAAESDHEVAGLELCPPRQLALPAAGSRDLDDVQAVGPGPALESLQRRPNRAGRVRHQGDTRRLLIGDHPADPNQQRGVAEGPGLGGQAAGSPPLAG